MHTEKTVYKDIYDFAVGSRVRGTVVEFIPFGARVDVEGGARDSPL